MTEDKFRAFFSNKEMYEQYNLLNNCYWFKNFIDAEPTREQFHTMIYGMTIMPDHIWYMSGRK